MYSDLTRDANLLAMAHMGHLGSSVGSHLGSSSPMPMGTMISQTGHISGTDVGSMSMANQGLPVGMGMRLSPTNTQDISNADASSTLSCGSSSSSSSSASTSASNVPNQRKGKGRKYNNSK